MRNRRDDRGGRAPDAPGAWLVHRLARLVPREGRADWLAEWKAELAYAAEDRRARGQGGLRRRLGLNARAAWAVRDVIWLRRRSRSGGPSPVGSVLRLVRRQPAFSGSVVATLAIGVGSATAIFSVVDGLLLRPVPFEDPDRLVQVTARQGESTSRFLDRAAADVWRARTEIFEQVRAHGLAPVVLSGSGEPRNLGAGLLEPGFLEMLGVSPLLGRGFLPEEATRGRGRVALLGHGFWQSQFGADPAIVGRTIRLDENEYTVVGVLPPTLRLLPGFLPVTLLLPLPEGTERVSLLGRLRPDISLPVARARLAAVSQALEESSPRDDGWGVALDPLQRMRVREVRQGVLLLAGAVGLLLCIACANAAGLLVLHGTARQRELAIRRALGATRGSVAGQLLAESLGLAMIAGAAGVALAYGIVALLLTTVPENILAFSYTPVHVDGRVLAFASVMTLLVGLSAGLVPSLRAANLSNVLASAGRGMTAALAQRRMRAGLVVLELTLAVILLGGAVLLGNSLVRLGAVEPGFDPDGLVLARLSLPPARYDSPEARLSFRNRLQDELRAAAGVRGVTLTLGGIPPYSNLHTDVRLENGDGHVPSGQPAAVPFARVDTAYFSVLGIPILDGRAFRAEDASGGMETAVIDRDLARFLWPRQSAVGRRFRLGPERPWITVTGVAGSVELRGPGAGDGEFEIYHSTAQFSSGGYFTVAVRVSGDVERAVAGLRDVIRSVDPDMPIMELALAEERYREAFATQRFLSWIMAAFAATALLLAVVGMYALISYDVAQRSRDIGVRSALGASTVRIVADVFRAGMFLVVTGAALGLAGALVLGRFLHGLVFGVAPYDPLSLSLAIGLLVAACAIALVLPARRAARVDPMVTLKLE